MDSSQELSPAPSISSKGFKNTLAKARIGRKTDTTPTPSIDGDDASDRGGIRNSVDSLIDRARSTRAGSVEDGLPSGPSALSKLVPGRVKKKQRRRQEAEQAQREAEQGRGRSVEDQTATSALSSPVVDNRSRSTLGDEENSLLTVESEGDNTSISKPPLTSHNSHIGYLTTTSPLIKTTNSFENQSHDVIDEGPPFQDPQYSKSNTLPIDSNSALNSPNLAPQHAATFDTRRSSQESVAASRSRGVSPGARIKDVFSVGSRKKNGSPPKSPSPDRLSQFGDMLRKGSKRNSVNIGTASEASNSLPQINLVEPVKSPTTPRDLPLLATTPSTPPKNAETGTPATVVTPPTPVDRRQSQDRSSVPNRPLSASGVNSNVVVSPSGNMISHRRVRSDSGSNMPSKLSQAMPPPMTPMPEEGRTPGGGVRSPSQSSSIASAGFFSSVFSAAQNMTNTLTNTMSNNPPRSRSSTQTNDDSSVILEEPEQGVGNSGDGQSESTIEKKPLAVDTLGSGDLRFSHLGISTDSLATGNSSNGHLPNGAKAANGISVKRNEVAARAEDASAARAVSAAYTERPISDVPVAEDEAASTRPKSYEASVRTGEKTPPASSVYEGGDPIRRSGSVRSRVSGAVRKKRNSSSATGNTIAAAIGGAGASMANPLGRKPTGFAVASKKRNRDFHQSFRSVPEDDYLIEDYSCALQKDIIIAGRIYISEGHICFSSNILGWVTTLVISFDEVVSVEKENTAMVFPNAIAIQTLHARNTFRSLLSREATYELLIGIWRLSHPNLKSSLNGARLDQGGTGDKTEKMDSTGSEDGSEATEDEEVYDEDQDELDEDAGSVTENGGGSVTGSVLTPEDANAPVRRVSTMGKQVGEAAASGPVSSEPKAAEKAAAVANAIASDFPGPTTHAPTDCPDEATHYDKPLMDDIIPAPLGKVYSMVFGPQSGGFMGKWLLDDMKCTELVLEDDKKGLSEEIKSRNFQYIKPLYASIGPKSTKCVVTETLDFFDLEKAVCATDATQTPDVPSGNVFVTKTHFCIMWAANNSTRIVINYTIEWSGKSWLKGPIEKGATDGQGLFCRELVKALKAGVAAPRAGRTATGLSKTKGGKNVKRRARASSTASKAADDKPTTKASGAVGGSAWGPLEPIHAIVSPIGDILGSVVSANMVIGFLLVVILFNYLRSPSSTSSSSPSGVGHRSPDRLAAYESLWAREEADLWDWLDQRVGVKDPIADVGRVQKVKSNVAKSAKQKILGDARMSEREVESAIRITEERLEGLKSKLGLVGKVEDGGGQAIKERVGVDQETTQHSL